MKVKIKRLNDLAKIPTRGSDKAAGYDLYAATSYDIEIESHKTVLIGTGLSMTPPEGYFGAIFIRSGIAAKRGLRLANSVAVIDEDYTGEYILAVHNDTNEVQVVGAGERIAQLVFLPYVNAEFEEVDKLTETERGAGGFGSTGS